jgi:hypothetical protein
LPEIVEPVTVAVPVRSLLTKKIAPPPSAAELPVIREPAIRSVNVLPSR